MTDMQWCFENSEEAAELINELEQRLAEVEAKIPRWIPVSERLPKSNGDYLISTKHIVTDAEFEGGEFYEALGMGVTKIKGVLAWQELQEVYKPK